MKKLATLSLTIVLLLSTTALGTEFKDIRYNGGTLNSKVDPKDWGNKLTVTSEEIRLDLKDGQSLTINPANVTGLSYGQEAHRRVGTMIALAILVAPIALFGLLHKTRLHFIGIEYKTDDGKKAGILLQAHKDNYRGVLEALRGATGAPVAVAPEDRKYVPTSVATVVVDNSDKGKDAASDAAGRPRTVDTAKTESGSANAGQPAEPSTGTTPPSAGNIKIVSVPAEAEVYVDGAFVGNAPSQLTLPAGKHQIVVKASGFDDWTRELDILPGAELNLKAVLTKKE